MPNPTLAETTGGLDEYFTTKETAAICKVSPNTVSMWLWKKLLPRTKAHGRTLIAKRDLVRFLGEKR